MSERPDWCFSPSYEYFLSTSSPKLPKLVRSFKRLAGLFPSSKLAASLVARRIRSGRLVRLPRASAVRTAPMSSLGGLRIADSLLYDLLAGGCGEGVPLGLAGSVALAAL